MQSKAQLKSVQRKPNANGTSSQKRQRLLDGLDPGNIITPKSDPDIVESIESSAPPTSSYSIRARSTPKSIFYDQKYHPMDEVVRPSHAASVRAKHDEPHGDSDGGSDSEATQHSSLDPNSPDSNSLDNQKQKSSNKKRKRYVARKGTRRSSRRLNHDALYNAGIHPQDSALKQLELESMESEDDSEEARKTSVITVEDSDEVDNPENLEHDEEAGTDQDEELDLVGLKRNPKFGDEVKDSDSDLATTIRSRSSVTPAAKQLRATKYSTFNIYEEPYEEDAEDDSLDQYPDLQAEDAGEEKENMDPTLEPLPEHESITNTVDEPELLGTPEPAPEGSHNGLAVPSQGDLPQSTNSDQHQVMLVSTPRYVFEDITHLA